MQDTGIKFMETKQMLKNDVKDLREEMQLSQKNEIETLRLYVVNKTDQVNSNNDGIYEQFEGKLVKIKEVCASYFSKYEKHLINHQTIVKDLER